MGLPSVVPSAETAKSEAEHNEREALSDMFSPSSPHGHMERIEKEASTALLGIDKATPFQKSETSSLLEKAADDQVEDDKGL